MNYIGLMANLLNISLKNHNFDVLNFNLIKNEK